MKSHTIPERYLNQFAYQHASTNSPRLWRYEKDRKPFRKASPHSDLAVRNDGHFSDPEAPSVETVLEKRLQREIEEPVNVFLSQMSHPSFVPTESQRRAMTRYLTLLFNRSRAKREAASHKRDIVSKALHRFLTNEQQQLTVATHWNLRLAVPKYWNLRSHFVKNFDRLFTKSDVIGLARKAYESLKTESAMQHSYAASVEMWISYFDDAIFEGEWRLLSTSPDEPFILSDAPVATWNRLTTESFSYGVGFSEPDVEIVLPISPLTCWHILPKVQRTRPVLAPTVREVNIAQAAFATRCCFSNIQDCAIDDLVQSHISTAKLGVTAFTLWHRNYDDAVYGFLMSNGSRVTPRRRVD